MEIVISTEFTSGALNFKNAQLKTATQNIINNMSKSKEAFVKAADELARIRDNKLYEKDFWDDEGRPSFAAYTEQILGISKTTAYRIIKTAKTLLAPELVSKTKPEYFRNFADATLDVITKVGDYDTCKEFCIAYDITETTPRNIVNEYVKAYKAGHKTIEEYAAEAGNEVEAEGETIAAEEEKVPFEEQEEKAYLRTVANMFKSEINALFEIFTDKEEQGIIKDIIKKNAKNIEG